MSKYLFIVQGEGRGHLTQAISLYQMLREAGHEVVSVLLGSSEEKPVPVFFREIVAADIQTFASPTLVYNHKTKGLDIWKTITTHLPKTLQYLRSTKTIKNAVQQHRPHVIVNFYEVVGGLYHWLHQPNIPMVCIGHQYLFLHPEFVFPKGHLLDRWLVNLNTRLTALGADQLLALSFKRMPNEHKQRIAVVPPLLRQAIKALKPSKHLYLLAYITQYCLAEELIAWHAQHPHLKIHCFWDNPEAQGEWHYHHSQLVFHPIDTQKFMKMMENCAGLVTTAGFEAVSEAMYLGKPVLMIPVPEHFEQACNALDAARAGAGMRGTSFQDLNEFINYLPFHESVQADFQYWQNQASTLFVNYLENLNPSHTQVYQFRRYSGHLLRRLMSPMLR